MNKFDALFLPAQNLLDTGVLFGTHGVTSTPGSTWRHLSDFKQAKHHAWHADDDLIEVWTDLREKHAGGLPDFDGAYEYWSEHYYDVLEAYLTSKGYEDLTSDVEADLFHCCLNLHFNAGDALWNDVMAAYSAGVWPCGWGVALFPQGNLLVFVPEKK